MKPMKKIPSKLTSSAFVYNAMCATLVKEEMSLVEPIFFKYAPILPQEKFLIAASTHPICLTIWNFI